MRVPRLMGWGEADVPEHPAIPPGPRLMAGPNATLHVRRADGAWEQVPGVQYVRLECGELDLAPEAGQRLAGWWTLALIVAVVLLGAGLGAWWLL